MDRPIFTLVYSSLDYDERYYFYGPAGSTQEQFAELCEELLPQAGQQAVLKQTRSHTESWVTWSDVVESLIPLLERQGYQRFDPPKYTIQAVGIIGMGKRSQVDQRLGYSGRLISEYNKALDDKLKEDLKPQKMVKKFLPQIMK